jgi:hypothetical protein
MNKKTKITRTTKDKITAEHERLFTLLYNITPERSLITFVVPSNYIIEALDSFIYVNTSSPNLFI